MLRFKSKPGEEIDGREDRTVLFAPSLSVFFPYFRVLLILLGLIALSGCRRHAGPTKSKAVSLFEFFQGWTRIATPS